MQSSRANQQSPSSFQNSLVVCEYLILIHFIEK